MMLAISIYENDSLISNTILINLCIDPLSQSELLMYFTTYDIQRLELYSSNMVDYHLIVDLLPELSRLFFTERINIHLSVVQCVRKIFKKNVSYNVLIILYIDEESVRSCIQNLLITNHCKN